MPDLGERIFWYGLTFIGVGVTALLTPQITSFQRMVGWAFVVLGIVLVLYLESSGLLFLLHRSYSVVGTPYPKLSLAFVTFLGGLIFGTCWWLLGASQAHYVLGVKGPVFSVETEPQRIMLEFGSDLFDVPATSLISPCEIVGPNGVMFADYGPIILQIQNEQLLVSVRAVGPRGAITIIKNTVKPSGWGDINRDDRALELSVQVNGEWQPQFQLITKSNTDIAIYGYFLDQKGVLNVATKEGVRGNPNARDIPKLTPIFKHPGWEYPCQRINGNSN